MKLNHEINNGEVRTMVRAEFTHTTVDTGDVLKYESILVIWIRKLIPHHHLTLGELMKDPLQKKLHAGNNWYILFLAAPAARRPSICRVPLRLRRRSPFRVIERHSTARTVGT